jgi:hypothetical protein
MLYSFSFYNRGFGVRGGMSVSAYTATDLLRVRRNTSVDVYLISTVGLRLAGEVK